MAKPKLALIPSTVGGSVYSVLPSNGDGDFDFSRASAATRINAQGLIETVAVGDNRLNYPLLDGTVQTCPHLLLEPQRTNLLTYSESFSNAYWTKAGASVVSGFLSPDGTNNAFKLVEDTSTGNHTMTAGPLAVSIGSVTMSLIVKTNGRDWVKIAEPNLTGFYVYFDITNDVIGTTNSATGKIIDLGNGYKRISMSFVATGNCSFQIRPASEDGTTSYTGDGTSGLYIWGAQLEAGSYSTSYIVSNSNSATTRIAEVCDGSGNASTFNDSEGVLMAQISALADDGTARVITINDGGSSDYIGLRYHTVSNTVRFLIKSGGTTNFDYFITLPSTLDSNKIAIKYDNTNVYLWANGIQYFQYSPITTPIGLSTLDFDDSLGNDDFYGKTKQIQYFDSALADSELETLTSWMSFSDMAIDLNYTIQ